MSTAYIMAEVSAYIAENESEWGKFTVDHDGYTFHVYYDAAFDNIGIEQVTYKYANGTQAVLDGLPRWFKNDEFCSVVFTVMMTRYEEIKAERAAEEADRREARAAAEQQESLRTCGDTIGNF